jgi:hypothetical protein
MFQFGKLPPHWNLQFRVSSTGTPQPPSGKCTRLSGLAISRIAAPRDRVDNVVARRSPDTPGMEVWRGALSRPRGPRGRMAASRTLPLDVEPGWPPGSLEAHLRHDQLSTTTLGLWGRYRRRVGTVTGGVGGMAYGARTSEARWQPGLPSRSSGSASGPVKPSLFRSGQIRPRHRATA